MSKHPNEFTRHLIRKFFRGHGLEVGVNLIENGYVMISRHFSAIDGCDVSEPAGRLIYDQNEGQWWLYWMSGRSQWHVYGQYSRLQDALDEMHSDHAAHLFNKVL